MDPTRRRTLRALGATAAGVTLAGCSSGSSDETTETPTETSTRTETVTPTDTDTPTPEAGTALVYDVTVLPELPDLGPPDAYFTFGERDSQWLVAEIAAEPDGPPVGSFRLETPTDEYDTTTDVGARKNRLAGYGWAYGQGDTGWLAVYLPKPLTADTAALTWEGGRHELDEYTVDRLNRPPATFEPTFEVSGLDGVYKATRSNVIVENTADEIGTFVGVINSTYPAYSDLARIILEVQDGDTAVEVVAHRFGIYERGTDSEVDSVELKFRWRGGEVTREVDFSAATPTPTDAADGT